MVTTEWIERRHHEEDREDRATEQPWTERNGPSAQRHPDGGGGCGPDRERSEAEDRIDEAERRTCDERQLDVTEAHRCGSDEVDHEHRTRHRECSEQQVGGSDLEVGHEDFGGQRGDAHQRSSADEPVREPTVDQIDQGRREQRNQDDTGRERDLPVERACQADDCSDQRGDERDGCAAPDRRPQRPARVRRRRCRTTARVHCHHDRQDPRPVARDVSRM